MTNGELEKINNELLFLKCDSESALITKDYKRLLKNSKRIKQLQKILKKALKKGVNV